MKKASTWKADVNPIFQGPKLHIILRFFILNSRFSRNFSFDWDLCWLWCCCVFFSQTSWRENICMHFIWFLLTDLFSSSICFSESKTLGRLNHWYTMVSFEMNDRKSKWNLMFFLAIMLWLGFLSLVCKYMERG